MNRVEAAQSISEIASKTTYASGSVAVVGGLSFNQWMALGGFVVGVLSFGVNLYYRHRMLQLAKKDKQQ